MPLMFQLNEAITFHVSYSIKHKLWLEKQIWYPNRTFYLVVVRYLSLQRQIR